MFNLGFNYGHRVRFRVPLVQHQQRQGACPLVPPLSTVQANPPQITFKSAPKRFQESHCFFMHCYCG